MVLLYTALCLWLYVFKLYGQGFFFLFITFRYEITEMLIVLLQGHNWISSHPFYFLVLWFGRNEAKYSDFRLERLIYKTVFTAQCILGGCKHESRLLFNPDWSLDSSPCKCDWLDMSIRIIRNTNTNANIDWLTGKVESI